MASDVCTRIVLRPHQGTSCAYFQTRIISRRSCLASWQLVRYVASCTPLQWCQQQSACLTVVLIPGSMQMPKQKFQGTLVQLILVTLCHIGFPLGALVLGPGGTSTQFMEASESVQFVNGFSQAPSENTLSSTTAGSPPSVQRSNLKLDPRHVAYENKNRHSPKHPTFLRCCRLGAGRAQLCARSWLFATRVPTCQRMNI